MERSRLYTYLTGAALAVAAAVVYLTTKNIELTTLLGGAAGTVLGYAKQHVADKLTSPQEPPEAAP